MSKDLECDDAFEADVAPFRIMKKSKDYPHWSVLLSQIELRFQAFASVGHTGHGYGWASVARHLLREPAFDDLASFVKFDPEADMFVAYSDNKQAILLLAQRLKQVFDSESELHRVLSEIPADEWSD